MRRILILTVFAVVGALAAFVMSTNNAWAAYNAFIKVTPPTGPSATAPKFAVPKGPVWRGGSQSGGTDQKKRFHVQ